jgi:hypothetical protein
MNEVLPILDQASNESVEHHRIPDLFVDHLLARAQRSDSATSKEHFVRVSPYRTLNNALLGFSPLLGKWRFRCVSRRQSLNIICN